MSDTPWTPGPWTWVVDDPIRPWEGQWTDDDFGPDFYALGPGIVDGVWHNDSTAGIGVKSAADARLIAAAPEMAELLGRALETSSRMDPFVQDDARTLLARVRGEV